VIVSRTGSINPRAYIFSRKFSPILLLTSNAAPQHRLDALRKVTDGVFVSAGEDLDLAKALAWLRSEWGVKKILCEGGGELNGAMFRHGLVDELYLTVCPVIFGGRSAPTLADGLGVERLREAKRFELKSSERVGDEMFCVFRPIRES
jgi:riboflavin-specific deaminase-like protein